MKSDFQMSMVGELTYFLELQVEQMKYRIFISLSKYAQNLVTKFGLDKATYKRTPAATTVMITKELELKLIKLSTEAWLEVLFISLQVD